MYVQAKRGSIFKILVAIIVSSVLTGLLVMGLIPAYLDRYYIRKDKLNTSPQAQGQNIAQTQPLDSGQITQEGQALNVTGIASKVLPSVVGISTAQASEATMFRSRQEEKWSVGSGVIVSADGYVLTNQHVVGSNPDQIVVTLADGKTVTGKTQWSDPSLDLAVIKVEMDGMVPATLGDSEGIAVGDTAVAIGNPLGLQFQRTVTAGIVSAINRTISVSTETGENFMEDLIQTDASINPGNSGGPLINSKGEVIGINTIKVTSAEGMGFAIPINITKPVIAKFFEKGNYSTPYGGVFGFDKTAAQYAKVANGMPNGVYVSQLDPSGPVYNAGISVGDIITKVGDHEVDSMIELREEMYKCGSGNKCSITYLRNGRVKTATFVLQNKTQDGLVTR